MTGHYLSNEICYSAKTQTFSSTKHTLSKTSQDGNPGDASKQFSFFSIIKRVLKLLAQIYGQHTKASDGINTNEW